MSPQQAVIWLAGGFVGGEVIARESAFMGWLFQAAVTVYVAWSLL